MGIIMRNRKCYTGKVRDIGSGNVDFSRRLANYSGAYTGSPITFNVDYTLTEDAWVYIMFSIGNGAANVKAGTYTIFQFSNYVGSSALATDSWVKLPKGTRITTTNANNGVYQAQISVYAQTK